MAEFRRAWGSLQEAAEVQQLLVEPESKQLVPFCSRGESEGERRSQKMRSRSKAGWLPPLILTSPS